MPPRLPIACVCLVVGLGIGCSRPNPAYDGVEKPGDAAPQQLDGPAPSDGPGQIDRPQIDGPRLIDGPGLIDGGVSNVGLLGEYFNDVTLQTLAFERVDPTVSFDWTAGPPGGGVGDHYGVRWIGSVQAPCPGRFTFYVTAGDGVRLWVDDTLAIDSWKDNPVQERGGSIDLATGGWHRFKLEYYHAANPASIRLEWSGPCQGRQPIAALQPPAATACPTLPSGSGSGLGAQYFSTIDLTTPVVSRTDPQIDFDFAGGPPDPRVPATAFSARWTGQLEARQSGLYQFQIVAADGVRLFLDDRAVILDWSLISAARSRRGTALLEAGRLYDLRLEYFESNPPGSIRLLWSSDCFDWQVIPAAQLHPLPATPAACPAPAAAGTGVGLTGKYFSDSGFGTQDLTRVDPTVNFNWGAGGPAPELVDNFSVRWTGYLQPRFTDAYTISFTSDDGVSMWLDGALVIDRPTDHNVAENGLTLDLQAGRKYAVRIDYHEIVGSAVARLNWSSHCQAKEPIPASQLYP